MLKVESIITVPVKIYIEHMANDSHRVIKDVREYAQEYAVRKLKNLFLEHGDGHFAMAGQPKIFTSIIIEEDA